MTDTHTPSTERVAANVRAELARRRVGQATLADALELSQASVSRRLTGEQPFTLDELDTLAALFGVTAAELVR